MSGGSFNYLCNKDIFDLARGVGERMGLDAGGVR